LMVTKDVIIVTYLPLSRTSASLNVSCARAAERSAKSPGHLVKIECLSDKLYDVREFARLKIDVFRCEHRTLGEFWYDGNTPHLTHAWQSEVQTKS